MTFGQRLRQIRENKGITQKELAEKLNVTFQTISKWENSVTEPDISTIKEIARLLNCSIEQLFNDSEEIKEDETNSKESTSDNNVTEPAQDESLPASRTAICHECGKEISDPKEVHRIQIKTESGITEVVDICDNCFKKREEEHKKKLDELNAFNAQAKEKQIKDKKLNIHRDDRKALIAGLIIGGIAFVATLIGCIINFDQVQLLGTIFGPLLIGYILLADIYCIFSDSFVSDAFLTIAGWSVHFPGIIFSWSLDGFIFLIAMKLLFFFLGILISILTFLLAFSVASILSVFAFIPLLISHKVRK